MSHARPPLILISPTTQSDGAEFGDASLSLSNHYPNAIMSAGGAPLTMAFADSEDVVREYVERCDGIVLTGGEDIQPPLYGPPLSRQLAKVLGPIEPERDVLELMVIKEVFRQGKPLLAICRGHQILNVALGGDLIVDIPTQCPSSIDHRQLDRTREKVHDVTLTPGSLLASVTGKKSLGVNSTHHQAVGRVADLLQVTARSSDGIVEALELKEPAVLPFMLSVQFHPERLTPRHKEFLGIFRSFVYACACIARKKYET